MLASSVRIKKNFAANRLPIVLFALLAAAPLVGFQNGGTITGTVRLPDGSPAAGVRVAAMAVPAPGTDLSGSVLEAITQTDEAGRFRLEDVVPGTYYVVAGRVNALTFYPGVSQSGQATSVEVTAGAEVTGMDFTVSPQSIRPDNPRPGTNPFFLLPPFNPILNSPPQVQIKGRIELAESAKGERLPDLVVLSVKGAPTASVRTDSNLTIILSSGNTTRRIPVAPDGTFTLDAPQGESTISLQYLPPGYTMDSMRAGSVDLTSGTLNVQQGAAEIVIVVSADMRPRFEIIGKVVSDKTLVGRQIELVSDSGTIVRLLLEPGGTFIFRNLLRGNYTLRLEELGIRQPVRVDDGNVSVELAEDSAQ